MGDSGPRLAEVAVVVGSVAEVEFEVAFGPGLPVERAFVLAAVIAVGFVLPQ